MSTPPELTTQRRLQHVSEALTKATIAQRAGEPFHAHVADAVRHMRAAATLDGIGPEQLLAAMRRAWSASNGHGHDETLAEVVEQCFREYFQRTSAAPDERQGPRRGV